MMIVGVVSGVSVNSACVGVSVESDVGIAVAVCSTWVAVAVASGVGLFAAAVCVSSATTVCAAAV